MPPAESNFKMACCLSAGLFLDIMSFSPKGYSNFNLEISWSSRVSSRGSSRPSSERLSFSMLTTFLYLPKWLLMMIFHSRSEEHTSELQSRENLVCRLLLEKK